MDAQKKGKATEERKRKQKFSERELELLTEEVVKQHEMLFGKKSLHVPESTKRGIWLGIQERINAIGVTHRSIDDLRKRWYDLRSRAKESVADRLKQAAQTGGGSSTADEPTAMEQLVESTLLPESVSGIGHVDSSAPKDNRQGAAPPPPTEQDREESQSVMDKEGAVADIGTPVSSPSPIMRRRRIVQPLAVMEDEEEGVHDTPPDTQEHTTPAPPPTTSPTASPTARARRRAWMPDTAIEGTVFAGLEGKMLRVQRMQSRSMRSVDRRLHTLNRGIHTIGTGLTTLTDTIGKWHQEQLQRMDNHTAAINDLCRQLQRDRASRRRERAGMHSYTKAVNRLCNTTAILSRRSVSVQVEMAHCSSDVARGLTQVTCAVEELKNAQLASSVAGDQDESEEASSRSTITPPITEPRRRSTRQGPQSDQSSHEGSATGHRGPGLRARKQ